MAREATVAEFATVQQEGYCGVTRQVEYVIKGFTLDDERLKRAGGGNYFDELLARIRDIRASEKAFWRKVLEIYATSIDLMEMGKSILRHPNRVPSELSMAVSIGLATAAWNASVLETDAHELAQDVSDNLDWGSARPWFEHRSGNVRELIDALVAYMRKIKCPSLQSRSAR